MVYSEDREMKKGYSIAIFLSVVLIGYLVANKEQVEEKMISERIRSIEDVKALFPQSPEEIKQDTERYIAEAQKAIDKIIAIPHHKRSYQNTAQPLDDIVGRSNLEVKSNAFSMIKYLHPHDAMRNMGQESVKSIESFSVDAISTNKKLYEAFKAYVEGNAKKESLTPEQQYFLDQTMLGFKHAGLDLPDDQLETVKVLKKKLSELSLMFERNIAEDNRTITVTKAGLAGCDDDFIGRLKKTEDENYLLGVDYPTYFYIMEHSDVEDTRKRLFELFNNRAYPVNQKILIEIMQVRRELAQLLGFESFAAYNIENQMAASPARVDAFLKELRVSAQKKANQELDAFIADLPPSVTLTKEGKIKAWDFGRIKTHYKEKNFQIDERVIAEYFPMQKTIDALLDIYHQFMSVHFKEISVANLWHDEVRLIEVYDKDQTHLYGYLLLDLHPRDNKYKHAAHGSIVPAITLADGSRLPLVSVVMANFPKPSKDKPSLLMRIDVSTFFHEFGHALHALMGATQVSSFAGTRVKTDFVEMPSQMLEEWLWDKEIIKKVSCHYKTGEPLPEVMIDNIIALKRYDVGNVIVRQIMLSQYSLDVFKANTKDPATLWFSLVNEMMPRYHWGSEYNFFTAFGHLTGYGAKYYGYLWSKVFALDLFAEIKKQGLLNPVVGAKYVQEVISKGGSCDPNKLLENFLGRPPMQTAFLQDMGLS